MESAAAVNQRPGTGMSPCPPNTTVDVVWPFAAAKYQAPLVGRQTAN